MGKFKSVNDSFLKRLARFKKFRDYLIKNRFDVVIDHRPKNDYAREVFYDQYLYRGIPRIFVVHNSNKENYFTKTPNKMARIYNKNLMNIAVSKYIENEILEKLKIKKHCTIHNPYNLSWRTMATTTIKEADKKPYVLWYGRLQDAHKDISFLIDAFQISEIWKKNIHLIIMGEGKDKIKLKEKADQSPAHDFITFLPFTNNPFPYIVSARVMALTSKYEGFPMVLVESLSVGIPVISLDIVSGPSEVIQHKKNGLLIDGRDPKKFGKAMAKMCFDDDLYQTCKKNAENSIAHFSMEIIGEK